MASEEVQFPEESSEIPIRFDNRSIRALPTENLGADCRKPRYVRDYLFCRCLPTPLENPEVVSVSRDALDLIGIGQVDRGVLARWVGGQVVLHGSEPAAHCYAGHQFGLFSGQLGDGAAIYLGETVGCTGERWEVQVKGAGKTPFSRGGDGRKVLRSSLREFVCSEAMHALGIPTTRAAALVASSTVVERDPLYDGNVRMERCAAVLRLAPSFLRIGSLEVCRPTDSVTGRAGPSAGSELKLLPMLLDHVIATCYPHLWADLAHRLGMHEAAPGSEGSKGPASLASAAPDLKREMYRDFCRELAAKTARLIAHWDAVGFVHAVLNTDNFSLAGVAIDYGPFAFLDRYDPSFVASGSDDTGRYAFRQQVKAGAYAMHQLATALQPVVGAMDVARVFNEEYMRHRHALFLRKLGLTDSALARERFSEDEALIDQLLECMRCSGADFTATFRRLSLLPAPPTAAAAAQVEGAGREGAEGSGAVGGGKSERGGAEGGAGKGSGGAEETRRAVEEWGGRWVDEVLSECPGAEELAASMGAKLPLSAIQGMLTMAGRDPHLMHALGMSREMLEEELRRAEEAEEVRERGEGHRGWCRERWLEWLGAYMERLGMEAVVGATEEGRRRVMEKSNPLVVPRTWMLQLAIDKAEEGDTSVLEQVMDAVTQPYGPPGGASRPPVVIVDSPEGKRELRMDRGPPEAYRHVKLTCSS